MSTQVWIAIGTWLGAVFTSLGVTWTMLTYRVRKETQDIEVSINSLKHEISELRNACNTTIGTIGDKSHVTIHNEIKNLDEQADRNSLSQKP